jgi:cation diffusion facilitator family transporter
MAAHKDSLISILYALAANLGIAIIKSIASVITLSGSMLAEAVHSFADCTNQVLLLIGLKRAQKPPSPEHPLGYGKVIYFWSFIVALMLFSMGGIFSIYEGVKKLNHPDQIRYPLLAIGILLVSIVLESTALTRAYLIVRKTKKEKSLWRWFRTSRQSELIIIIGEDLAAVLGLLFALTAIFLTMVTNNPVFDAYGSLSIGILLVVVAICVGIEIKSLLIGESAGVEKVSEINKFLTDRDEVSKIFNLKTLQFGNEIMVAVKAKMKETDSARNLIENINRCESALKKKFPQIRWIFFEPDIRD